jgi:hypothetical protein
MTMRLDDPKQAGRNCVHIPNFVVSRYPPLPEGTKWNA